jgi:segregation and condensation protein B
VNRDESQESLASQAAAWVPPWERARPEPEDLPEPPDPDEEPGTPELEDQAEPAEETEPDGEPDDVEVTVPADAPAPEPFEAAVAEPEGEELSPEAAGTRAEQDEEDAPPDADLAEPDAAGASVEPVAEPAEAPVPQAPEPEGELGQLALEGLAPPLGELPAAQLRAALEAILLVVDEPVGETLLAQALEQPTERISTALGQLAGEYEGQDRGFELRRAAGGWRLYTRSRYAAYVERFVLDGQSVRLTQAALETLAVVAYKQPVTRSRISAIRGVNCDGVVRTLVTRGLIEECGAEPETGAHLYRTTGLFLEKLGLDSVDQLPPLAPFLPDDVDAIADAQAS